jgi:hypothetical protein
MSAVMRDLVRATLARSLYVAVAFAVTLLAFDLAGQAPERSVWDWVLLTSVLSLLSLSAGVVLTYFERQR